MAALSQTVTNSLPLMAMSPAVYWNALTWGTDNWGYDGDTITEMDKGIANATSISTAIFEEVEHLVAERLAVESAVPKHIEVTPMIAAINLTEDVTSLSREWGVWDYIFTKPTIEAVDAVYDEFSKVGDTSSGYSTVTTSSTTWTGV